MEKLYYKDLHLTDFDAKITSSTYQEKEQQYQIVLDRTAFFPEEGGQVADSGTLNGYPVIDVQIKEDVITHMVKAPADCPDLTGGCTVHGKVNWEQRFDFMQQHSGEHIISGLVHRHFGCDNVGFHLGLREVTLDFNKELTLEQLRWIEAEANRAVWNNLPIQITCPSRDELTKLEYRSKLDFSGDFKGDVRIVEIPGIDVCACCAPHVETTGQIGLIKITNVQNHRGGVRVNILCGARAVADYTEKQDSVSAVSVLLSAPSDAVSGAVVRLQEENLRLRDLGNDLQARLLQAMTDQLPSPAESPHALLFVDILNEIALRNAVNDLAARYPGYAAGFAGNDVNGYRFIIGSVNRDCRELATLLRSELSAKGGGSAPMIQGSVKTTKKALETLLLSQ